LFAQRSWARWIAPKIRERRCPSLATAVDQLLSSGALENLSGDQIEEELRRHADQQEVAQRLEQLKQQQNRTDASSPSAKQSEGEAR